jgi:hypothetical protein
MLSNSSNERLPLRLISGDGSLSITGLLQHLERHLLLVNDKTVEIERDQPTGMIDLAGDAVLGSIALHSAIAGYQLTICGLAL